METLTMGQPAFTHLLAALQKARSIAAEGGYLDLLDSPFAGASGLDRWVGDERTVGLMADLASGDRACTPMLWLNLALMVEQSSSWSTSLAVRGVEMPDRTTILAEMATTPIAAV